MKGGMRKPQTAFAERSKKFWSLGKFSRTSLFFSLIFGSVVRTRETLCKDRESWMSPWTHESRIGGECFLGVDGTCRQRIVCCPFSLYNELAVQGFTAAMTFCCWQAMWFALACRQQIRIRSNCVSSTSLWVSPDVELGGMRISTSLW